jgi:hypothetical protein
LKDAEAKAAEYAANDQKRRSRASLPYEENREGGKGEKVTIPVMACPRPEGNTQDGREEHRNDRGRRDTPATEEREDCQRDSREKQHAAACPD